MIHLRQSGFRRSIGLLVLQVCIALCLTSLTLAQCTQQPPSQVPPNAFAVPPGSTVYYQFDANSQGIPNGSGTTPSTQVQNAFNAWSVTNSQAGGVGTSFTLADATHPATVTISADQSTGNAAASTSALAGVINAGNPATITLHPDSFLSGSSTNLFQVFQPGYSTAYFQVMMHEIAHLMGINDYPPGATIPPPGPNRSVAAPTIGVNDQGDTAQKSSPTECDKQQAKSASSAIASAASGSGSGNGGGTGGGGKDGGTCYAYVDYSDPDNPILATQCIS